MHWTNFYLPWNDYCYKFISLLNQQFYTSGLRWLDRPSLMLKQYSTDILKIKSKYQNINKSPGTDSQPTFPFNFNKSIIRRYRTKPFYFSHQWSHRGWSKSRMICVQSNDYDIKVESTVRLKYEKKRVLFSISYKHIHQPANSMIKTMITFEPAIVGKESILIDKKIKAWSISCKW